MNVFESSLSGEDRAAALRAMLPPGTGLDATASGDPAATVLDITALGQQVLVAFRWMAYPHRLAYAIGPHSEYSDDAEVEEPARWADDAVTWLEEQLGTGLVVRAARHRDGDNIELTEPGWPFDNRFYGSSIQADGEDDRYAWEAIDLFEHDGFDTATVQALRADGTASLWIYASLRRTRPRGAVRGGCSPTSRYQCSTCSASATNTTDETSTPPSLTSTTTGPR